MPVQAHANPLTLDAFFSHVHVRYHDELVAKSLHSATAHHGSRAARHLVHHLTQAAHSQQHDLAVVFVVEQIQQDRHKLAGVEPSQRLLVGCMQQHVHQFLPVTHNASTPNIRSTKAEGGGANLHVDQHVAVIRTGETLKKGTVSFCTSVSRTSTQKRRERADFLRAEHLETQQGNT
jgi:hypothetical protein